MVGLPATLKPPLAVASPETVGFPCTARSPFACTLPLAPTMLVFAVSFPPR